MPAPCLFLSHSGADTEGARELKRRLLEAPESRETGLTVWFDKDDLKPGLHWQEQLEVAITRQATAFAVLVGSKGVINWVEREVRLGLARATGDDAIPFVSIVAEGAKPEILQALPAFAQQHQGVIDPLNDPAAFAKLLDAILGRSETKPARLTDEPFVGLRAMTEREADRFFGRTAEVAELVDDLRRHRLVAIVADSGAGKSSLAMAGLAPAFRGGAVAAAARRGSDDAIWHVVVMRPGADPLEGLRRGVTEAAERMGLSPDARASLRRRLTLEDVSEAAYALRCDLPAGATETLLIVDQFDELLTETPEVGRQPFIDFVLKLAALQSPGGVYVVLTVRVDYFNLCRPYGTLYAELQASERVLRLKRISDAGLEQAVRAPLRMAGFSDEADQHALASEMRRDLGDRPGDLALAQMALWTVWRNRHAHGGSLLKAYVDVGGVSGALAQEAEQVRLTKLSEAERLLLPALFVRLVRLGETGGVLRRLAGKDEFDEPRAALAEKLASDDHGRLLLVGEGEAGQGPRQAKLAGRDSGGARVEVCHEALITQWPWLQNTLNAAAADLRVLDRLMDRAATWTAAPADARGEHRATGAERELFAELGERRDAWLSSAERAFIGDSNAAYARETAAKRASVTRLRVMVGVLGLAVVALFGVAWFAIEQTKVATEEKARAEAETRIAEVQKARAQEQTALAGQQARNAEAQKARADVDFGVAKATINRLISNIVEDLGNAAGMPVTTLRRVLDTVRAAVDALAATEPEDRGLQRNRFAMLADFSDIYLRAGDVASAAAAAEAALQMARGFAQDGRDTLAQRLLATALDKVGSAKLRGGDRAGARKAFDEELAVVREFAKDRSNAPLQRDLAVALERVGDVRLQTGDRAGAGEAFDEELTIDRDLAKDKSDAQAQRSLAIALEKVGGVRLQAGDRAGAVQAFDEELAIERDLAKDKADALAQRSLAIALEKVGDVELQAGDRLGAGRAYDEELTIFRDLARDKGDAQAQRSLAIALERVGDVDLEEGDRIGARRAYDEELAVFRDLAKDKSDVQARQSMATALEKIGDVERNSGDLRGAQDAYDEVLAIERDLAEDKGDAQAQRFLAIALEGSGDLKLQGGDRVGAEEAYDEELVIVRNLAGDKGDAQAQRSLAIALNKLGDVKKRGNDLAGAEKLYDEELTIDRDLARDKGDARAQRDLAVALERIGDLKIQAGDLADARKAYDEELVIERELAKDRGDAQAQSDLALAIERVGIVELQAGDRASATAAFTQALAIFRQQAKDSQDPQGQLSIAVVLLELGSIKFDADDRIGAKAAFEEELGILQRLAAANLLPTDQRGWIADAQDKLAALASRP